MQGAPRPLVSKGNCGIPRFEGTQAVYSGTPELMAKYAHLAIDGGARIVGGCCGTTPTHLAAMRKAIDSHVPGPRPTVETIVEAIGPLTNSAPTVGAKGAERRSRRPRA
jgi:5-methyltetrahydrofolate--homocysteine methyltransferase